MSCYALVRELFLSFGWKLQLFDNFKTLRVACRFVDALDGAMKPDGKGGTARGWRRTAVIAPWETGLG